MVRGLYFEKVSLEQFTKDYESELTEQIYKKLKLPTRSTIGSAGYDFYAPEDFTLKPKESINIPTGIRVHMGSVQCFLGIYPRSGLGFKYRAMLDNTVAIIDKDYYFSENEGHIFIKITNCGEKEFTVKQGQGYCQGIFQPFYITDTDYKDTKQVRNGGHGSTDKVTI